MSIKELTKRYFLLSLSIFLISLGISTTVSSQLGISPISSGPYVFSVNTPLSIGACMFILNAILIVIQMAMLGGKGVAKNKLDLLLQLPVSLLFGACLDFTMWLLNDLHPESYPARMVALIAGCVILALGIALEVTANVAMMSGEYTIQLSSKRFKKEFGTVKMIFDVTLVCLAILSSMLFSSTIVGIREGTIITAIITGPLVKLIMPRLKLCAEWLETETKAIVATSASSQAVLITISREYGSGGHAIGEMLAQRLGIPFYDHKLVEMVAHEGDFDESFVGEKEQSLNTSLLNMMIQDYEAPIEKSMSPEDLLFVAQSKVLNRIAEQGSCVIVGRCASYILDHYPNNISVFLHADIKNKTARVIEQYGISADKAEAEIKRIDKSRADHFYYYTGKPWGSAQTYQLCCDTGAFTPQEICDSIEKLYHRAQA